MVSRMSTPQPSSEACTDPSTFESPNAAKDTPLRVKYDLKNVETKIAAGKEGEPPVGLIPVDKAWFSNSKTKKWESGVEYKDNRRRNIRLR